MVEFSSEMGSFLQQKRDRNQRLKLEDRQRRSGAAGQLSQQIGQKIGWKQSAEQLNALGSQNLTDWIPVSWTEVASRGVDPIVQDINFRAQQATAALRGISPEITDPETGISRTKTSPERQADATNITERGNAELELSRKYGNLFEKSELGDAFRSELAMTPAYKIPQLKAEYEVKFQTYAETETYKNKVMIDAVSKGINVDGIKDLKSFEDVRAFYLPKLSAKLKLELDKQNLIETNEVIAKARDKMSNDDDMMAITAAMVDNDNYKDWFDDAGRPTDETYTKPERMSVIKRFGAQYGSETKLKKEKRDELLDKASVWRGTFDSVNVDLSEKYEDDIGEQNKAKTVLLGLQSENPTYTVDNTGKKTIIKDLNGEKVYKGDDADFILSLNKTYDNYAQATNYKALEEQADLIQKKRIIQIDSILAGKSPYFDYATWAVEEASETDFGSQQGAVTTPVEQPATTPTADVTPVTADVTPVAVVPKAEEPPVKPIEYGSITKVKDEKTGADSIRVTTATQDIGGGLTTGGSRWIKAQKNGTILSINADGQKNTIVIKYDDDVLVQYKNVSTEALKKGNKLQRGNDITTMLSGEGDEGYVQITAYTSSSGGTKPVDAEKYLFGTGK